MKIKNIFLTLLVSGLTFFCLSANLSAEVLLDPLASGDDDYIALLEGQGESAYAFDFFTTSMLWTVIAAALVFLMHLGFATLGMWSYPVKKYRKYSLQKYFHYFNGYSFLCSNWI